MKYINKWVRIYKAEKAAALQQLMCKRSNDVLNVCCYIMSRLASSLLPSP